MIILQFWKRKIWFILVFTILFCGKSIAQSAIPNANLFSSVVNYFGNYSYGANAGYYGANWTAENTATIAIGSTSLGVKGVGVKSLRVPLYDDFLSNFGLSVELPKLQYYASLGANDLTAFVGSPSSIHRLDTTFSGAPESSKVFKNLYEPIWLDLAKTQVNPNNYYAKYLYDVVNIYGAYVKFWEVMNEPDFTYSPGGWSGDSNPVGTDSWFYHNPLPSELENIRAPIFYYIRELHVAWEIIKRLQPRSYVSIGGLGYRSFLDAVLRNTDNPLDGSVNSQFPDKGGAFFDVMSFHIYPEFALKAWNNSLSAMTFFRHSDAAANAFIQIKDNMQSELINYGYNNSQYPKKQVICTETGVSRIMDGDNWGSIEGQRNYLLKAQVQAQKNDIKQTYWFQLGDNAGLNQFDRMGLYYYFGGNTPYNQQASDQGKGLKTLSDLLYGKTYDQGITNSLNLPSSIQGAAFRSKTGSYTFVLWAITTTDLSETAFANYSFPSGLVPSGNLTRKEWDFSETGWSTSISANNISLNGTPSLFEVVVSNGVLLKSNAGPGQKIMLPTNNVQLDGSLSTGNPPLTYQWSKVSGPSLFTIVSPNQAKTSVLGLIQGTYLFELLVKDNNNAVSRDTMAVSVAPPVNNVTVTIPAKIEAENYTAMSGVQIEPTTDSLGGRDVGYIDPTDWMEYKINVPADGNFTINYRVASVADSAQFDVKSDSMIISTVNIPKTGGYQTWITISSTVFLKQGQHTIRIVSKSNNWNLHWLQFLQQAVSPATSWLRVEAENYTAMSGVQTEVTSDVGGGLDVDYIDPNDWMDYTINLASAGTYTVNFRVASPAANAEFQVRRPDGTILTTVKVPNTGGFQIWQTVSASIQFGQGQQTIRLVSTAPLWNNWNINWMEFNVGVSVVPVTVAPPIHIEAENYTAMSGVQTEPTTDIGGGLDVDYIDPTDWMDYTVNVPTAGSYNIDLRIASPAEKAQLQIRKSDSTILVTVNLPKTGGFQQWATVRASVVLVQGAQTIRIYSSSPQWNNWNINWFELSSATMPLSSIGLKKDSITSFIITPNPLNDKYILGINSTYSGNVNVKVIDSAGVIRKEDNVLKAVTGPVQIYLSIGTIPPGSYNIKVQMGDWIDSKKAIL
ncbi:MAG: hypothetical protein NVS1B13_07730 [Flavisolibacter sp.]